MTLGILVVAHLGLIVLFSKVRPMRERPMQVDLPSFPILIFEEPAKPSPPAAEKTGGVEPTPPSRRALSPPSAIPAPVEPEPSTAIHEGRPDVDWRQEAQTSAHRALEGLNDQRRQGAALAPQGKAIEPYKGTPQSTFGWYKPLHRIERTEDGTTILWLNDRCVLANMLIPICSLEAPKPKGDLFKHMDDPADPRTDIP